MKEGKLNFIEGAYKKGYTKKLAEQIFGFMEKFAAYGFNKAHATSYALIAYWTAYMKANYPVEFMTALMTAELQGVAGPQREFKMAQALEEGKRMKIKVLPPDINKSVYKFSIEGRSIRFGMSAIKNVGSSAIDSIIESREKEGDFPSFSEFLYRVDLRKVNKRTVESLIKSSAFDAFGTKASLLMAYPQLSTEIAKARDKKADGQFGLFGQHEQKGYAIDSFTQISEYPEEKLIEFEKEVIGFLITRNPMEKHAAIINKKVNKRIGELTPDDVDKTFVFAGTISSKKIVKTKKTNAEMAFMQINDISGTIEMVVFPKTYAHIKNECETSSVILFRAKVSEREGEVSLLLDKAVNLDVRTRSVDQE